MNEKTGKIEGIYQGLSKRAQSIIAVIVVLAIAFIIYEIIHALKKAGEIAGSKEELNQNKTEIQKLQALGIKQSYPDSQYLTWANDLQQALNGCWYDGIVIDNVFGALKNDMDFLKLKEAFGTREVKGCLMASNQTTDMTKAINWKVLTPEIINTGLAKKGIKYQV